MKSIALDIVRAKASETARLWAQHQGAKAAAMVALIHRRSQPKPETKK